MIDTTAKLHANPRCLLTELEDRTGVLLHLDTKFYFTLNDTGVFVWKLLADKERSAEDLADELTEEFEVSRDDALAHIRALLDDLHANRLIERR